MLSLYDLGWLLLSFVFSSLLSDAPQVSLRLGRTLDADNIRTGHDVYFECDVKANPPALRLEWLHNVSIQFFSLTVLLFSLFTKESLKWNFFHSIEKWYILHNEKFKLFISVVLWLGYHAFKIDSYWKF